MKWNRVNGRNAQCPKLESLEARQLLSTTPQAPQPASSPSAAPIAAYDSIIGASATRTAYGVDGTGLTVAVIDTGVNYNHEALGGGFGAGKKVVAGYDFAMNDADPFATTWEHGTAVAGLIASDDPAHLGVAPGAKIAALRVFGDDNQGDYNRIADSLQWVLDNRDKYHISVVNLSVADGGNYTQNIFAGDGGVGQRITQLISKLKIVNIPVVSAAGNSFSGQVGEGFTAIVPDTISVTATDGASQLASNAQRLGGPNGTDVAAPGTGLVAPIQNNQFQAVDGTSFATALVSGSVLLLQQIYFKQFGALPAVTQVEGWLRGGADAIADPVTNISLGRLDLPHSAALIPIAPKLAPVVVVPPVAIPTPPVIITPTVIAPIVKSTPVTTPTVKTTPVTTPTVKTTPVATVTVKNTAVIITPVTTADTPLAQTSTPVPPKVAPPTTVWTTWLNNFGNSIKTWKSWTAKPAVVTSAKPGPSQPAGTLPKPVARLHGHHPKAPTFVRQGTTTSGSVQVR